MRKLSCFLVIISILIALNLVACRKSPTKKETAVQTTTQTAEEEAEEQVAVNLIFIQTAKTALIKKIGTRGYYMITLHDINPYLIYYTERPKRTSGIASINDFIKAWNVGKNNFHESNPNALVTGALIDGVTNQGSTFYLMTCSTPEYNIKKKTLSYVIKPLPKHPFIFDHIKLDYVMLMMDSFSGKHFPIG